MKQVNTGALVGSPHSTTTWIDCEVKHQNGLGERQVFPLAGTGWEKTILFVSPKFIRDKPTRGRGRMPVPWDAMFYIKTLAVIMVIMACGFSCEAEATALHITKGE